MQLKINEMRLIIIINNYTSLSAILIESVSKQMTYSLFIYKNLKIMDMKPEQDKPLSKVAMMRQLAEKLFRESGLILEDKEPQNELTVSFKKPKEKSED